MKFRRSTPPAPPIEPEGASDGDPNADRASDPSPAADRSLSLDTLPIAAGITRRRLGWALGLVITVWVVVMFARQVGAASAAQAHADQIRQDNATLADQVAALDRERTFIQQAPFVMFQARAYMLGSSRERPFALSPDAPPLRSDAPGSAAARVGAVTESQTPLESWLSLLFGPSR
ncbi:MAG TPA: hypothetical protein VNF73_08360 [Candidatus Saccharimonadales bacterium]|nr:hypothetical protein [Candidatus Saccharimonadales bacterium]